MGITVIGITHPAQLGTLPGGTNVVVLADDGTFADEFLDADFGAHQLVVRAHGRGAALFSVADKAHELGAERILFGGTAAALPAEEEPVLLLDGPVVAFNRAFHEQLLWWPRPAEAYRDAVDAWLRTNALRTGLRVVESHLSQMDLAS